MRDFSIRPVNTEHTEPIAAMIYRRLRNIPRADFSIKFAVGGLSCGAFALVYVLIHQVALDETIIAAEIITKLVHYPAGHPHAEYYKTAYSLSNFLSAAAIKMWPNVVGISAVRNWAFLFLTVLVPFTAAVLLTGRLSYGFLASLLTLCGAHLIFRGLYPVLIYPSLYSNGHMGLQLGLLTVMSFLGQARRTGGFLLGLMPAVHLPIAALTSLWALWYYYAGHKADSVQERARVIRWLAVGLLVSAALAAVILATPTEAAHAPYVVPDDGGAAYETFTRLADFHRRPIPMGTLGYVKCRSVLCGRLVVPQNRSRATCSGMRYVGRECRSLACSTRLIVWLGLIALWVFSMTGMTIPSIVLRTRK